MPSCIIHHITKIVVDQRSKECKRLRGGGRRGETFDDQEKEGNVRNNFNTKGIGSICHIKAKIASRGSA
jgi:hypothetical protein